MSQHTLERRQVVPGDMDAVFGFFQDPTNLEAITPPWLHFEVRSATDARVRLGTEISYRLRWRIFPMTWRSRISEYEDGRLFADEMLKGPYKRWYHRHLFKSVPGGVEVVDIVAYELPFGPLGRLVHRIAVRSQLESIFEYRHRATARIFGALAEWGVPS
jgi:ligand-binding SRPBCC domain-containing protein